MNKNYKKDLNCIELSNGNYKGDLQELLNSDTLIKYNTYVTNCSQPHCPKWISKLVVNVNGQCKEFEVTDTGKKTEVEQKVAKSAVEYYKNLFKQEKSEKIKELNLKPGIYFVDIDNCVDLFDKYYNEIDQFFVYVSVSFNKIIPNKNNIFKIRTKDHDPNFTDLKIIYDITKIKTANYSKKEALIDRTAPFYIISRDSIFSTFVKIMSNENKNVTLLSN